MEALGPRERAREVRETRKGKTDRKKMLREDREGKRVDRVDRKIHWEGREEERQEDR